MDRRFRVARNPDPESRLPYLIWLPIESGLILKARKTWPRVARVFCFQDATPWDENAEVVDEAEVVLCRRRGAAIDLVLDRAKLSRSQFVFTTARGRPAVWWQTLQTARSANPGARVPRGRAAGVLNIALDTREKYGWRFASREVSIEQRALPAGDYAATVDGKVIAVVERKSLADLATSLSNGSLAFQMQRLAECTRAAVVVEGEYPDLFRTQPGRGAWLADMLGRLAARYPEVPVIFASSRKFAEEWTYRFFGAAAGDSSLEAQPSVPNTIMRRSAGVSIRESDLRVSPDKRPLQPDYLDSPDRLVAAAAARGVAGRGHSGRRTHPARVRDDLDRG